MKNKFKYILFAALFAGIFSGCDDDTELPPYKAPLLSENFNVGADGSLLETEGWINFAQTGNAYWTIQTYDNNGYAEFTSYQSGEALNVGWLISPPIALEENNSKVLRFDAAQAFVSDVSNKLEVLVSTNFDGTDVASATWTPVQANLPGTSEEYYLFIDSGEISLSGFSGNAYVAFKVTGSGTNGDLDGTYQIDNVYVY